ncbi:MAG: NADH-quinone oxidoreductase subunit F, partial [Gammaproteobacteria bacterium]|nr:NADH-quinone oxidoreductase subunit F [Gammaproteobacteria bacterium]
MSDRPLTKNIVDHEGPTGIARYEARGGYSAVRDTIGKLDPNAVLDIIKDSNLRGRGGAGFPTGMKW